jgi:hypothetical protein
MHINIFCEEEGKMYILLGKICILQALCILKIVFFEIFHHTTVQTAQELRRSSF